MTDNRIFKLEEVRIRKYAMLEIEKGQWPMCNGAISSLVKQHISHLQREIALLSKQGLQRQAFAFMDHYVFSISNRLVVIHALSKHASRKIFGIGDLIIETDADCCSLLNLSKYTVIKRGFRSAIYKKNNHKKRYLNMDMLLDKVLQCMLINLLSPYYEVDFFLDSVYCRKGCFHINAIAQLREYLVQGPDKKTLILLGVTAFYGSTSWKVLREIRVPSKFKNLIES